MITLFPRTVQLLTFGVSAMKTIASLTKTTAIGGLVFLLPLVLLVAIVGKAFNIIRNISMPEAIYLPGAPDTRSGSVAYFTNDRVVPLDTDFAGIASCLKTLGRSSSKIISDTPRLQRNV